MAEIKNKFIKKVLVDFLPSPLCIGIETNDTVLKMVLLKKDSPAQATLLDYAILPLTASGSASKEPSSLVKGILTEKKLFEAKEAKIAVSGAKIDSKRIELPLMPKVLVIIDEYGVKPGTENIIDLIAEKSAFIKKPVAKEDLKQKLGEE